MTDFISLLNENTSLISSFATVAIAFLTAVLWGENRKLRKAGHAPDVVAYLSTHKDGNGAIEFVLANVGKGPAFDVKFTFLHDEGDFFAHNAQLANEPERAAISVLPQNEKIRTLLGVGFQLYGNLKEAEIGPLKPFEVSIDYKNSFGHPIKRLHTIDIKQFAGLRGILAKSDTRRAAESIEKIEEHMEKLARASTRYSAFVDITEISDDRVKSMKGNPENDQGA